MNEPLTSPPTPTPTPTSVPTCVKIQQHVHQCTDCKRKLSFDPVEKALIKSYSIKNDILELLVFIITGILLIIILNLIVKIKMYTKV